MSDGPQVEVTAGAERVEQVGECRLVEGHRGRSFVVPARNTLKIPRWPPRGWTPATPPSIPTIPRGTHRFCVLAGAASSSS